MSSPEDIQKVLRARARKLAEPPGGRVDVREPGLKLLEFRLAQESYAVEERWVQEVQPLKQLAPLPCAPRFLTGILNLRGRILPVLDLRIYLGLPEKGVMDLHQVIFVQGQGMEFGLLADIVIGTRVTPLSGVQPPLPALAALGGGRLQGMTADRVLILDMDRIVADPKIVVNEEVET